VRSVWEKSSSGPDRRTYELTRAGNDHLNEIAGALVQTSQLVDVFLSRYEDSSTAQTARRARARRSD
jgi:DNA-binding PadR family transcriptional regulator